MLLSISYHRKWTPPNLSVEKKISLIQWMKEEGPATVAASIYPFPKIFILVSIGGGVGAGLLAYGIDAYCDGKGSGPIAGVEAALGVFTLVMAIQTIISMIQFTLNRLRIIQWLKRLNREP